MASMSKAASSSGYDPEHPPVAVGDAVSEAESSSDGSSDTEAIDTEEDKAEPTSPDAQSHNFHDHDDKPDDDAPALEVDIIAEIDGAEMEKIMTLATFEGYDEKWYDSEVATYLEQGDVDVMKLQKVLQARMTYYNKLLSATQKAIRKADNEQKKKRREAKKAKDKEEKAKQNKEEKEQTFKVSLVLPDATVVQFELSKGMTTGEFRLLVGTKVMGMSKKATKKMSLYLDTVNVTEVPRRTIAYYKDLCEGSRVAVKFSLAGGGKRVPLLLFPYFTYVKTTLKPYSPKT